MSKDRGPQAPASPPTDSAERDHASVPPRRKSLQSGFSLLARGEPKIWFTGGMLVVCLAMIVGLLALIVVSGLPTFWARPIDLLALDDGTLEIGQLQAIRSEVAGSGLPARAKTPEESDKSAGGTAPDSLRAGVNESEDESSRRYYRTGNFKVTGRHYRWLSSRELGPAGVGRPEWAMVVERLEWGRLYGLPLTVKRQLMPSDAAREKLAAIEELQEIFASVSIDQAERLASIQQALEAASQDLKDLALREQVDALDNRTNADLRAQTTDSADWQAYATVNEPTKLTAVMQKWNEYEVASAAMQSDLEGVIRQRNVLRRTKFEISRLDARLSELRVDVRRAELETNARAKVQVESAHYLLERLEFLTARDMRIPRLRELLAGIVSGDNELAAAAQALLDEYRAQSLGGESTSLEEQLAEWAQLAANQPQRIRDSIAHYQQGYREIVRQKQPLEKLVLDIEESLNQTQIDFAVPTNSVVLPNVADHDIEDLLQGQVSVAIREQLASQGVAITDDSPEVEAIADLLTLVAIRDKAGDKRLLAVSKPGYLVADDSMSTESTSSRQLQLMAVQSVGCREIVRTVEVNRLGLGGKLAVYFDRWREFLLENPREANTEGGVFPAIWGTVVMTLIMTIAVVPFGVMAALYLREYTRSGALVSMIRISINNLAGVPSIVYGVFGFSFFCYTIGAFIDGGAKNADITPWPSQTWFAMLGLAAVIGTGAFFSSFLGGVAAHKQTAFTRWMSRAALVGWLLSLAVMAALILKSPFFNGLYAEYLPNPTFGKGGLLWASLTLALLTLPVVIVATEEALAAVPNSLREGSLACGASKWQTIWRIVLPHARPGILTGAILAMARGAGEVAPLMLVGALPSAPDLPLDGDFPFFHGSRSFMHLGYQIYTLGFQSQNSEAAKPMVFTCTLLLILIVATLNLFAIFLRARLRRKFQGAHF